MVAHDAEDGYPGIKWSRLTHSSMRTEGQEELCMVCKRQDIIIMHLLVKVAKVRIKLKQN